MTEKSTHDGHSMAVRWPFDMGQEGLCNNRIAEGCDQPGIEGQFKYRDAQWTKWPRKRANRQDVMPDQGDVGEGCQLWELGVAELGNCRRSAGKLRCAPLEIWGKRRYNPGF